jgi:hypothetical protein
MPLHISILNIKGREQTWRSAISVPYFCLRGII